MATKKSNKEVESLLEQLAQKIDDRKPPNNDNDLETAERILGIENLLLRWLGVTALFITTAFVIIGLVKTERKYYGKIFFGISVFLLLILLAEFLSAREKLEDKGIEVPTRVKWLAVIMAVTIVVLLVLIYDYSQAGEN